MNLLLESPYVASYELLSDAQERPGPEVIKLFSCSTQLSTKFILLINVKMPTIVGILTFISKINTTSERLKARNFFICQYFSFYEQLKFRAQLSWAWKKFYNLKARSRGYKTWIQSQTRNKVHWLAANHCALFEFENELKFYNLMARSQGYKTIFILNWAEYKIYPAHKC